MDLAPRNLLEENLDLMKICLKLVHPRVNERTLCVKVIILNLHRVLRHNVVRKGLKKGEGGVKLRDA